MSAFNEVVNPNKCAYCAAIPSDECYMRITNNRYVSIYYLCGTCKNVVFNDETYNRCNKHKWIILPYKMTEEEAIEKYKIFL